MSDPSVRMEVLRMKGSDDLPVVRANAVLCPEKTKSCVHVSVQNYRMYG